MILSPIAAEFVLAGRQVDGLAPGIPALQSQRDAGTRTQEVALNAIYPFRVPTEERDRRAVRVRFKFQYWGGWGYRIYVCKGSANCIPRRSEHRGSKLQKHPSINGHGSHAFHSKKSGVRCPKSYFPVRIEAWAL